ncbi:MAG TPA: tripartite tricarboxylate transporter substrate binding protein [Xanthobacteraceae bacterium]|nr:tripartite tricarboxylate transporter substrate binding protein [Xanthobacteraceae bacterium]
MLSRRSMLLATAASAGLVAAPRIGLGQSGPVEGWPSGPVRVVSPAGAGGPSQNFRLYADHLQKRFGQPFVLENIPGASGAIGAQQVLRAPADGHTLILASNSTIVLAPLVIPNFPVHASQFDPIALFFRFRFLLLANHQLPVRSLAELVAYAKERPGQLSFGSPGIGTGGHVVTELMVKRTGIKAVHVPFKSTTQQMMDTAAGNLQFTFDTIGNARGMVEAGKLIPLAVTGAARAPAAPDIPTFKELGYPGFENLFVTNGLLAPKGSPKGMAPAAIRALNAEISRLNGTGPIRERLESQAYEVGTGSPDDYAAMLAEDIRTWSAVVKETGIGVKA